MLRPFFHDATKFAQTMSKKPKPYAEADKKAYDKKIKALNTQIEKVISKLSETERENFEVSANNEEQEPQLSLKLKNNKLVLSWLTSAIMNLIFL